MTGLPLTRTEYWSLSIPGSVRTGATGHGESLTDMENFLLPLSQSALSALRTPGVADGLAVTATAPPQGLTVSPGVALDVNGHLIVLAAGGVAIVDPAANPSQLVNVPTVQVSAAGATVATAGSAVTGDVLLTVTYAEVVEGQLSGTPVLVHAPWLRLVAAANVTADQVVLAGATLDSAGNVTGLSPASRPLSGLSAAAVQIRRTRAAAGPPLSVDQSVVAQLAPGGNGGLRLDLTPAGGPLPVLAVDDAAGTLSLLPAGGTVGVGSAASLSSGTGGGLEVGVTVAGSPVTVLGVDSAGSVVSLLPAGGTVSATGALRVTSAQGQAYQTSAGADGAWHFTDATAGTDRLLISQAGSMGLGIGSQQPGRILHVEGNEVHSGGTGGGFSFADRNVGQLIDLPQHGERWIWYADGGAARLWSGEDRLWVTATGEGGGLDVGRRMRVRQATDTSAGIWFFQTGPATDRAFVGMADDTHVGFWGNTGAGWGLRMDTGTGQTLFSGDFGRPDGPSTLSLFGSRIGDVGNGVLFIRSGGNVVAFDGGDNVGINTSTPQASLDVSGPNTAIIARGGSGAPGIQATGATAVWAQGSTTGIAASGSNLAGWFMGTVLITKDLHVQGALSKGGGGFKIDHPLDPAGKYLSHSFVESPEMLNVYAGTAVTDDAGKATVTLPDYFEVLNRDHRFQLTPLGQLALATVEGGVSGNRFAIRTDRPGVTVSWQVTGVRQDPWAQAHRVVAEQDKAPGEQGFFLHAEEHGQPESMSLTIRSANQGWSGIGEGEEHEGTAAGAAR